MNNSVSEYNTVRPPLILKEYGRNMQKLVDYIKTIEDREKRTQAAYVLVELMKLINPNAKSAMETTQKLWDDLYIMAGFDIDIDSPYPPPDKELLNKPPQRLTYKESELEFKHYGRNILYLVKKAMELEDPEERESAVIKIGKLMKSFQSSWNRENVDEVTILRDLKKMSKGQLTIDIDRVRAENLFDSVVKERKSKQNKNRRSNGGRRRRN